jgi:hypothetical protein
LRKAIALFGGGRGDDGARQSATAILEAAMAKWTVYAAPILGRATETEAETKVFTTDNAAKGYIRDLASKNCAIRLSSAPGVEPAIQMQHGEALAWAHS